MNLIFCWLIDRAFAGKKKTYLHSKMQISLII